MNNNKQSSRILAQQWPYGNYEKLEKHLRDAAEAWFKENGVNTHYKMPYCVSSFKEWKKNIIDPEVSKLIENDKILLHKYIHHGLSSQAMLFNLIGPLKIKKDFNPIIEILKSKGVVVSSVKDHKFEYADRDVFNEDFGQPTSIDLYLKTPINEPDIFIECKLAEREFGGCSVTSNGNCSGKNPATNLNNCYLHYIGRKYWALMKEEGFMDLIENEKICPYASYYQFFREILFAIISKGIYVLLYDKRSPVFFNSPDRGLIPFLMNFVPEKHKSKLVCISIQELSIEIQKYSTHYQWITMFNKKYGLDKAF